MRVAVTGLLIAAVVAVSTVSGEPVASFGHTMVGTRAGGEPGVVISPAGIVLVTSVGSPIFSPARTWHSDTDGASFVEVGARPGAEDTDVSADAVGSVYAIDMVQNGAMLRASVSTNGGTSYSHSSLVAATGSWDRPWIAAVGDGRVVVTARDVSQNPFREDAWISNDAGRTWIGPILAADNALSAGRILVAPDGALLVPFCTNQQVEVARSTDNGTTWRSLVASPLHYTCDMFPSVAVDDAGGIYVTWMGHKPSTTPEQSALSENAYFAASKTNGTTWTAFRQLNPANVGVLFPWITAGASGRVAVAYYASSWPSEATLAPPTTQWEVDLVTSLDANAAMTTFSTQVVAPDFHTGSICIRGSGCPYTTYGNAPLPGDRRVLDFFQTVTDATGHVLIVHPQDRSATSGDPNDVANAWVDIVLERQVAGPLLR